MISLLNRSNGFIFQSSKSIFTKQDYNQIKCISKNIFLRKATSPSKTYDISSFRDYQREIPPLPSILTKEQLVKLHLEHFAFMKRLNNLEYHPAGYAI